MSNNEEVPAVPIAAFIQARMSSSRFPGKVLAPFRGTPIIRSVLERVQSVPEIASVVVATSEAECDDPLVSYVESLNVDVFRGPLNDVFGRFAQCWKAHPCEWVLRICADSPLVNPAVLQSVILESENDEYDIVTTRHPCTFPKGWNADLVRASAFFSVQPNELTDHDREHVVPFFINNPGRFRLCNFESGDPELAKIDLAVDSLEDLRRVESEGDMYQWGTLRT